VPPACRRGRRGCRRTHSRCRRRRFRAAESRSSLATFTFTSSDGIGATFDLICLSQAQATIGFPQLEIVDGGSGYEFGDILDVPGGTLAAHGQSVQVLVQEIDGGIPGGPGALTGARIRGQGGQYLTPPSSPSSMTGGHGAGATVNLVIGSFPVSNPGNWGIDPIDGTKNPPAVIGAVAVAGRSYADTNAIQITMDKPLLGPNPQFLIACRREAGGGGATGARSNIAGAPYSDAQGYWGQFSQPWAARQAVDAPYPYAQAPADPILINGDFSVWPLGDSVALPINGYACGAWQVFRGNGVPDATAIKIASDGESFGMKVARTPGQTYDATSYSVVQTIDPSEIDRLIGQLCTVSLDLRAGADFSDPSGTILVSIYVSALALPLQNNGLPSGASGLGTRAFPISTVRSADFVSIPLVVPIGTQMIILRAQWAPSGTAGADDSVTFSRARIDLGPVPRSFQSQSVPATNLRLGGQGAISFALSGMTGAQFLGHLQANPFAIGYIDAPLEYPMAAGANQYQAIMPIVQRCEIGVGQYIRLRHPDNFTTPNTESLPIDYLMPRAVRFEGPAELPVHLHRRERDRRRNHGRHRRRPVRL